MLDLKTPFEIRDSAIRPYHPKLLLADLPGISAVLVMPDLEDLGNWAATIERLSPEPGSFQELYELFVPGFVRELRSMEEASDEFGRHPDFRAKLADLIERVGDPSEAKRLSIELASDSPSPASAYRLARVFIDEGDLEKARLVLEGNKKRLDFLGLLRLAQVYALQGSLEKSAEVVEEAIELDATDYRGWMFKGTLAMASQKWEAALQSFRAAIEEPNNSSTLRVNLSFAYLATDQVSRAIKELRIASRLNPRDVNAVALLCDLAIQRKTPEVARSAIELHFAAGGRSPEFLERAAKVSFAIGEENRGSRPAYEAAKQYLANLLSQSDEPHIWNNLGVVEARLGNVQKSLKHFSHSFDLANKTKGDWSLPLSNILVTRIQQKEYRLVEKATREVFKSKKVVEQRYWPKVALQRCAALEGLGERSEAASFLEGVLDFPGLDIPSHTEMLSSLVIYYSSVSSDPQTVEKFLSALSETVADHSSELTERQILRLRNNMAFAFLQLDRVDDARKILDKARYQKGRDPYLTATFGLERLKAGRFEAAEQLYNQAIAMTPDRKLKDRIRQRMRFEFAKKYFDLGDYDSAEKFAREALKPKLRFAHVDKQIMSLVQELGRRSKDQP